MQPTQSAAGLLYIYPGGGASNPAVIADGQSATSFAVDEDLLMAIGPPNLFMFYLSGAGGSTTFQMLNWESQAQLSDQPYDPVQVAVTYDPSTEAFEPTSPWQWAYCDSTAVSGAGLAIYQGEFLPEGCAVATVNIYNPPV